MELVHDVGVSPNIIDKWDATPLYYTSSCGYLEATKVLLQAGATADPHQFVGARCMYQPRTEEERTKLEKREKEKDPNRKLEKFHAAVIFRWSEQLQIRV